MSGTAKTPTSASSAEARYLVRIDKKKLPDNGSDKLRIPGADLSRNIEIGADIELREMTAAELKQLQDQVGATSAIESQEITTTPSPTKTRKYGTGGSPEYAVHVNLAGPMLQREQFEKLLVNDPQIRQLLNGRENAFANKSFDDANRWLVYCDNQRDAFVMRARINQLLAENKSINDKLSVTTEISAPLHVHVIKPVTNEKQGRELSPWAQQNFGPLPQNTLTMGVGSTSGQDWMDTAYGWFGLNTADVIAAVGDTGVRSGHAAFYSNTVEYIPCVFTTVSNPTCQITTYKPAATPGDTANRPNDDPVDHGTWVAGQVISSVPNALLIDLQIMGSSGSGTTVAFLNGLKQLLTIVQNNPDKEIVVNFSIEWSGNPGGYNSQIQAVLNQLNAYDNFMCIAAAGNDEMQLSSGNACVYPACFDGVIAVGAYATNLQDALFSNYGKPVLLAAPGTNKANYGIVSASNTGAVTATNLLQGTSMAAPNVAGHIAKFKPLFKQLFPGLTKADLVNLVTEVALNPSSVQYFDWFSGMESGADQFAIPTPIFNLDLRNIMAFVNSPLGSKYKTAMAKSSVANVAAQLQQLGQSIAVENIAKVNAQGNLLPANSDFLQYTTEPLNVGESVSFPVNISEIGTGGGVLYFGFTSAEQVAPDAEYLGSGYYSSQESIGRTGKIYKQTYVTPSDVNIPIASAGTYNVKITRQSPAQVLYTVTNAAGKVVFNQPVVLHGSGSITTLNPILRTYNCEVVEFNGVTSSGTAAPTPAVVATPKPTTTTTTARPTHKTPAPSQPPTPMATPLPTGAPIAATGMPTPQPTGAPTIADTKSPHKKPTAPTRPTKHTKYPSSAPTVTTFMPSLQPTQLPTPIPTAAPTPLPTTAPSAAPSIAVTTESIPYADCAFITVNDAMRSTIVADGEIYLKVGNYKVYITATEITVTDPSGNLVGSNSYNINLNQLTRIKISNNNNALSIAVFTSSSVAHPLISIPEYNQPSLQIGVPQKYGVKAGTPTACASGRILFEGFVDPEATEFVTDNYGSMRAISANDPTLSLSSSSSGALQMPGTSTTQGNLTDSDRAAMAGPAAAAAAIVFGAAAIIALGRRKSSVSVDERQKKRASKFSSKDPAESLISFARIKQDQYNVVTGNWSYKAQDMGVTTAPAPANSNRPGA